MTDAYPAGEEKQLSEEEAIAKAKEVARKRVEKLKPPYDIDADVDQYWKIFTMFDKDHGGSVDNSEVKGMIESLGISLPDAKIQQMVLASDVDNSGEIDFDEFVIMMRKEKDSLGSMASRALDSKKLTWRREFTVNDVLTTKVGDGVVIDDKTNIASRKGAGFGVLLLEPTIPGEEDKRHKGTVLFDVAAAEGAQISIGFVGNNFAKPLDGAHWQQDFGEDNEKKAMITSVCSDGGVYQHGANLTQSRGIKGTPFGSKDDCTRVQIDFDIKEMEMTMHFLDKGAEEVGKITIGDLKHMGSIAVCFGPTEGEATSTIRLVGSALDVAKPSRNRRGSKDLWDEGNEQTLANDTTKKGGVGLSETFGP